MLQKLSGNTEDSQLIRHGMKAHLIFELYSTLLVPFGKLQLEFFYFLREIKSSSYSHNKCTILLESYVLRFKMPWHNKGFELSTFVKNKLFIIKDR